jgi:hypothetical protein
VASGTSYQAWSKGLDAGTYRKYLTTELRTANVAYLERKIQLTGFSSYLDVSPSQLARIIGDLLHTELTLRVITKEIQQKLTKNGTGISELV